MVAWVAVAMIVVLRVVVVSRVDEAMMDSGRGSCWWIERL